MLVMRYFSSFSSSEMGERTFSELTFSSKKVPSGPSRILQIASLSFDIVEPKLLEFSQTQIAYQNHGIGYLNLCVAASISVHQVTRLSFPYVFHTVSNRQRFTIRDSNHKLQSKSDRLVQH